MCAWRDTECCDSVSLSYSVDASEVTDLHVISYEVERDLMPLILSNCQYQVEQGQETLQEFDLEKVERQVTSRFLQGKPRLTLKVWLAPWYLWGQHICFVKVGLSVAFLQRFPSELGGGMTTQLCFPPRDRDFTAHRASAIVSLELPRSLLPPRVSAGPSRPVVAFLHHSNGIASHP